MAITALCLPTMTDEQILQQFDSDTRFCIIPDHYNTSPIGYPRQQELLQQNTPLIEQLMVEKNDVVFLTNVWHEGIEALPNVEFLPVAWLPWHHKLKNTNFIIKKTTDPKIANITGGKTRINRTLAGHWLAKNYPMDELIYQWTENDTLMPIQSVLEQSPYYSKTHIKPKTFLTDTFLSVSKIGYTNHEHFLNHFLPNIYNKSLLSIVVDAVGIELANVITQFSLYPFAGQCIVFLTGVYQIDRTLKDLGFFVFDDIFDYDHLQSRDLYALTIMGFEHNKHLIKNKEKIRYLYEKYSKEIFHNYDLACKNDDILNRFKKTLKIYKESFDKIDNELKNRLKNTKPQMVDTYLIA